MPNCLMGKTIIANPPLGIYKNKDITIGQAFYLVRLDASARARLLLGEEVIFPTYAFNVFGRRGDLIVNPEENARDYIKKPSLRERLSLCSDIVLSDDEFSITEGIKETFRKLAERGYLIIKAESTYLDVARIKKENFIEDFLKEIRASERTKKTLLRCWEENMNVPHPITKPTNFSISNPFGGENIGPLFTLANLWDIKYPNAEIVMAGSEKNLTNYIFLRMATQLALRGNPGVSEIYIYPQVNFAEGIAQWDLDRLTMDLDDRTSLRQSLLSISSNGGKGTIDFGKLKGSRKSTRKMKDLGNILTSKEVQCSREFLEEVAHFETEGLVMSLNKRVIELSRDLAKLRSSGDNLNQLNERYSLIKAELGILNPELKNAINWKIPKVERD